MVNQNRLKGVSEKICRDHVCDILTELCADDVFDIDAMVRKSKENLFDCLKLDFLGFAEHYYELIEKRSCEPVAVRLTLIPIMPRLRGISFELSKLDLGLLDRQDADSIDKKIIPRFGKQPWLKEKGAFQYATKIFQLEEFGYLAFCVERGTKEWCLEQSYLKLRAFVAVIMSYLCCVHKWECFQSVIAPPPREWMQFSEIDCVGWCASAAEPLMPFLAHGAVLEEFHVRDIRVWYQKLLSLPSEKISRVEKCANYVNLGSCADGMLKFILCYIALDALFGRRWAVERSIAEGIDRFNPESSEKAAPLFDLRNEIMHGGSRTIEEWKGYQMYVGKFRSTPERDILKICLSCLFRFPGALI